MRNQTWKNWPQRKNNVLTPDQHIREEISNVPMINESRRKPRTKENHKGNESINAGIPTFHYPKYPMNSVEPKSNHRQPRIDCWWSSKTIGVWHALSTPKWTSYRTMRLVTPSYANKCIMRHDISYVKIRREVPKNELERRESLRQTPVKGSERIERLKSGATEWKWTRINNRVGWLL